MSDSVFEAFDRLVEEPEERWTELAHELFPTEAARRNELLLMLQSWKQEPDFRVRTQDLQDAINRIGTESSRRQSPPEIEGIEIIEELGTGGSGTVFKCKQLSASGRIVAVKVFAPRSGRVDHMLREATALARLNHPHIASLYTVGTATDGRAYALLEYVDGNDLATHMNRAKPDLSGVLALFGQICEAVAYANEAGIIHRDLKPSNILVKQKSGRPEVKVLDFSISRALTAKEEQTINSETIVAGTPEYMSPEQADPGLGPCTTRSDVFSLGTVFYELLAGVHPYLGTEAERPSLLSILQAVRDTEPIQPSLARARYFRLHKTHSWGTWSANALRGDLDAIVICAQRLKPAERYPSAREMFEDIRRYTSSLPIRARRLSPIRRLKKASLRHPVWTAGIVLTTLSLVCIAGLSVWGYQREMETVRREAEAHARTRMAFATSALIRNDLQLARQQLELVSNVHRSSTWFVVSRFIDQSDSAYELDNQGIADIYLEGNAAYIGGRSGAVWKIDLDATEPVYGKSIDRIGKIDQIMVDKVWDSIFILSGKILEIWSGGILIKKVDLPQGTAGNTAELLSVPAMGQCLVRTDTQTYLLDAQLGQFTLQEDLNPSAPAGNDDGIWSFSIQHHLVRQNETTNKPAIHLRGHTHTGLLKATTAQNLQTRIVSGDSAGYVRTWSVTDDLEQVFDSAKVLAAVEGGWVAVDSQAVRIAGKVLRNKKAADPHSWWGCVSDLGALLIVEPGTLKLVWREEDGSVAKTSMPFNGVLTARPAYDTTTSTLWIVDRGEQLIAYAVDRGRSQTLATDSSPITAVEPDPVRGGVIFAAGRSLSWMDPQLAVHELCDTPLGTQFIAAGTGVIVACETRGSGLIYNLETKQLIEVNFGNEVRELELLEDLGLVAVGRGDGSLALLDIITAEETASLPLFDDPVSSICYGSDSVLRCVSARSEVHRLDLARIQTP